MGWSRNEIEILWATADTKSVAAAADEPSDDVTLTAGPWAREIMVKVDNAGTPAAADIITVYWQAKGDPDHDTTDEYATQATILGPITTYGNNDFGDANDGGSRTFGLSTEFGVGRLVAISGASSNAITVSAILVETIYTA